VDKPLICTIGHSNRPIETFIDLLRSNDVVHVLDLRTVPRSRHNPQFNRDELPTFLDGGQISYTHIPGLGGLRHARVDSPNGGWHNISFRGYADYMQSTEFADNLQRIMELASTECCALMCAEAVPWRCHRSLIGDALLVRGLRVEDIIGPKGRKPHILTAFAHVEGTQVTYPPPELSQQASLLNEINKLNESQVSPLSTGFSIAGMTQFFKQYMRGCCKLQQPMPIVIGGPGQVCRTRGSVAGRALYCCQPGLGQAGVP